MTKLARFFDRLSSLSAAGLPLLRALEILGSQEESKKFKSVLIQIESKLRSGLSFTDTLELFGSKMPSSCINIIRAGELSGNLDQGLARAAKYLSQKGAFRAKLLRSMAYPMFVVGLSILSLMFLFVYLLPTFSGIFESLDTNLPLITLLVIGFGDFIAAWKTVILLLLISMGFALYFMAKKEKGALMIDKIKLQLPVMGGLVKKSIFSQTSSSLGEMLCSGVPILTALEAAENMMKNAIYKKALIEVREKVESGRRLFEAMAETGKFPKTLIQLVQAGEESGELGKMLKSAAVFYEEETEQTLKLVSSLIEPIATVTAGIIVGIIVMALFMPLVTMVSAFE